MAARKREHVYRPRVLDSVLRDRLSSSGAVLLEGPKGCGKSFTAEQVTKSQVYLDLDTGARDAIRVDPELVLDDRPPQLIDEWQLEATVIWNYVRDAVNRRGTAGQFVLTGSAVPDDDAARHTGAGRVARLRMRPMSLYESGDSTGTMSLAALLAGRRPTSKATALTVLDIVDLVARGGWPMNLDLSVSVAAQANRDYLKNISEVDIVRVDRARNDPRRAMRLLQALARNIAVDHNVARLTKEADGDESPMARTTAYDYLNAFERLMARLRTAARTHFTDPSLAVAAVRASPKSLLADLNAFGYLFESLVVRDCRIYSDPIGGSVYHYRDSDDLEVDIIVESGEAWGAFEVKLGVSQVDEAATNLLAFARKVDSSKVGDPAVLGVITGSGYGYERHDGVVVIPVGALGP
jgi:predicted AAA+ superfamily ATPase